MIQQDQQFLEFDPSIAEEFGYEIANQISFLGVPLCDTQSLIHLLMRFAFNLPFTFFVTFLKNKESACGLSRRARLRQQHLLYARVCLLTECFLLYRSNFHTLTQQGLSCKAKKSQAAYIAT